MSARARHTPWFQPKRTERLLRSEARERSLAETRLPAGWVVEEAWCSACPQSWAWAHPAGTLDPGACDDCGARLEILKGRAS